MRHGTRKKDNGYDASLTLMLTGESGLLDGERIRVRLGESVIVGRSRACDLSTRRSRSFLAAPEEEQRLILVNRSFLRVSRHHVRITFLSADHIEVWDLSRNGTFIDGKRVDRMFLRMDDGEGVAILLADSERLRLTRSV